MYIAETRNQSGDLYHPKTIYTLLYGIVREISIKNRLYPNFMQDDPDFVMFTQLLKINSSLYPMMELVLPSAEEKAYLLMMRTFSARPEF